MKWLGESKIYKVWWPSLQDIVGVGLAGGGRILVISGSVKVDFVLQDRMR